MRIKTKGSTSEIKVALDFNERRKDTLRKKYRECEEFRLKLSEQKRERYENKIAYRSKLIQKGVQKYALDLEHRTKVQTTSRKRSKVTYSTNLNL